MRAYSLDLRKKIVDAVERGTTKSEVARLFGVSRSSVKRYVKMAAEVRSLAPSKPPGLRSKIDKSSRRLLEMDLEERPAATLAQRRAYLLEMIGLRVSVSTVWRWLKSMRWSCKKRSVKASGRDEWQRAAWRVLVSQRIDARRLVFVDEMGTNTSLSPLHAWSPRGKRALCSVPRNRGRNITLVASMTCSAIGPCLAVVGSTTKEIFEAYVENVLAPTLEPDRVVVMDNLAAHKEDKVREMIEGRGCELLYLPPYSPDFNPIEEAFSKIKRNLHKAEARSHHTLVEAVGTALSAVTSGDARNLFEHCGYRMQVELSSPQLT